MCSKIGLDKKAQPIKGATAYRFAFLEAGRRQGTDFKGLRIVSPDGRKFPSLESARKELQIQSQLNDIDEAEFYQYVGLENEYGVAMKAKVASAAVGSKGPSWRDPTGDQQPPVDYGASSSSEGKSKTIDSSDKADISYTPQELYKKRCKKCLLCQKEDCGKCDVCVQNRTASPSQLGCCYQKVN